MGTSRDIVAETGTTMAYKESVLLLLVAFLCSTKATCSVRSSEEKAEAKDAANYKAECIAALENQVRIEFEASLQYILMAAHFEEDTVNLPNVAKLFWDHADEERSHAIQFIQYLRMRGADNNDFFGSEPIQPREKVYDWQGVGDALTLALKNGERCERKNEGNDRCL